PVVLQLPVGTEDKFEGIVDLVRMKAVLWVDDKLGGAFNVTEIPADLVEQAKTFREQLIEKVSEVDDGILEKYLGGEEISEDEIRSAIRRRTVDSVRGDGAAFVPVLCGSAFKNKGVETLLDAVVDYLPSP